MVVWFWEMAELMTFCGVGEFTMGLEGWIMRAPGAAPAGVVLLPPIQSAKSQGQPLEKS